jgi:predicted  nucleic acid-binding Zn-ribbon protein
MSHSCAVCGAVYDSIAELDNGACPACHACKFIYEAPKGTVSVPTSSLFEDNSSEVAPTYQENKIAETIENIEDDTTVSIRIQRPGSYEINLLQMSESSDRVIGVEKKGVYHLDLHSMVGKKKKK